MNPALFRLEALFEEFEHLPDMLVLGSSDAQSRTVGELLSMSGESISLEQSLGYTETRGDGRLRDAIAAVHGRERDEVLVTVGANEAIFLVTHALLSPGDRALICTPAYQSIPEMARHAGADVESAADDAISRRIAEASPPFALAFLNSPHNPTGRVLRRETLRTILEVARDRGTRVVVDEVMSGIFAEGVEPVPSASRVAPEAIVIGNTSKSLGLGGLRVGWITGPRDVVDACTRWRYYTTISPPVIVQDLARIALEHRERILAENEAVVRGNHRTLTAWAERRVELQPWEGGTVLLARLRRAEDDEALIRRIAREARVFIAPGSAFGLPGHLRIGLGMQAGRFQRALERITPFFPAGAP